jgi:hypothetical protein
MRNRSYGWFGNHPLVLRTLVLVVVIANVWFDFHNLFWAIFDGGVLLVIGLVVIFKHERG